MMEKLNIGQMMELKEDRILNHEISGEPTIFKKGTKFFVGVSRKGPDFFHTLRGQMLAIDPKSFEVINSYSVTGIAEWIYAQLSREFPIDEMLDNTCYDDDTPAKQEDYFKRIIADALEELGMYDHTGNRS